MEHSNEINALAAALAKAQGLFLTVKTDSVAKIETKTGSSYRYTYASLSAVLDVIRKPLADNGLALVQAPDVADGVVSVTTRLVHTSGQWIGCTTSYPLSAADIKAVGSAISYLRRYSVVSLLGLAWDDDDGTATTQRGAERDVEPSEPQHWSLDDAARRQFHAERERMLREAGVVAGWDLLKREALGVEHLTQYGGSMQDALNAISEWIAGQVNK